jgi:carbon monoxide dehydrogenase subunit G
MPEASGSTVVDRPQEEVFAFLADGENDARWRSGVVDVRRRSGDGLGAVYEQGVKGPFGRRVAADYEITAFEPTRRIDFRAIAGPVRPHGTYRLESADGGTRVTFRLRCDLNGAKKLMAPMVGRTMRSEVGQLDRLREVLEEGG